MARRTPVAGSRMNPVFRLEGVDVVLNATPVVDEPLAKAPAALKLSAHIESSGAEVFKQEAESLAVELKRKAPEIRTRIVEVQVATPDSLRNEPSIVLRDSLIADLRNEADGWRRAYEVQGEALALVEASRDSLTALVKDRPGERPWYIPTIGVGPYAGIDATGRPSIGPVAVTLSWRIRL